MQRDDTFDPIGKKSEARKKLAGATKSYNFSNFNYGYQYPYTDVLHITDYPREKFAPKYKVVCNDINEDEFIKEGIRMINQQK